MIMCRGQRAHHMAERINSARYVVIGRETTIELCYRANKNVSSMENFCFFLGVLSAFELLIFFRTWLPSLQDLFSLL